ncbi:hypothetical protein PAXRUDRAFT_25132 [Paxillus rubicundulus Ve08.2h10]|uniref:Uncharacterized protein n=1 Tax=Paxillus rubicundulus Ve08.2h10 TaxID=930991 RepID=A0A0D0DFA0_9AGAM|nr:hypothetical protein PAXRUDRAFT_25132 [Paxillus rubicundulus Ve08.2h10]
MIIATPPTETIFSFTFKRSIREIDELKGEEFSHAKHLARQMGSSHLHHILPTFLLGGLFAGLSLGVIPFFFPPHSPEKACFSMQEERSHDGAVSQDDKRDGFSWIEFLINSLLVGSFEPSIVAGFGYAGNKAQLMNVLPLTVAYALSMISVFVSNRYHCRGYTGIFFSVLEMIGFSMVYVPDSLVASKSNHIYYGSLFFSISCAYGTAPPPTTWIPNNSTPHVRQATSVAIAFIMTNAGGILATWLLNSLSPAPNYAKATITFVIMSIGMAVFSALNLAYPWREIV